MPKIFLICVLFLLSHHVYGEALFPGPSNFVARGCAYGSSTKMTAVKFPGCGEKMFCTSLQGSISCYFIKSSLLNDSSDWKKIADVNKTPMQDKNGSMNWIYGVTSLLCPAQNGSCESLNLDSCANFSRVEMDCSLKNLSPTFKTIPRSDNSSGGIQ